MQRNEKTDVEKMIHASIVCCVMAVCLAGWFLVGWLVS